MTLSKSSKVENKDSNEILEYMFNDNQYDN